MRRIAATCLATGDIGEAMPRFATGAQTRGGGVSGATIRPTVFCESAASGLVDRDAIAISIRAALLATGATQELATKQDDAIPELHGDDRLMGDFVSHGEWWRVRSL